MWTRGSGGTGGVGEAIFAFAIEFANSRGNGVRRGAREVGRWVRTRLPREWQAPSRIPVGKVHLSGILSAQSRPFALEKICQLL